MDLTGRRLRNYQLIQHIGSGGIGEVYISQDMRIDRQVAIKMVRSELTAYPNAEEIQKSESVFHHDMSIISRLDHPHILPLFDFGEGKINSDDCMYVYLVMPYRQEGSLVDWLRRRYTTDLISPQDTAYFIQQAADALQAVHDTGIVHQNVKPSNFLVRNHREQPDHPDLLLADFGISKIMNAPVSDSQSVHGTPAYMPPELWENHSVSATDQYSLAIMAYELLTGHLPFQGGVMQIMYKHLQELPAPPSQFNSQFSVRVDQVILKALEKKPEQRFTSILDFAHAFQQAIGTKSLFPIPSQPTPTILSPVVHTSKGVPLVPGTLVHERYRIDSLLASGGMGRIYKAYHKQLDQFLALKEIVSDASVDSQAVQQTTSAFLQESRILSSLNHQHLPKVYDAFVESDRSFIAMDYIDGKSLEEIQKKQGPIPEATVRQWLVQLCDVLEYLHKQSPPIIFRDLKPANIMLQSDGTLKLIDFGIARFFKVGQDQDTMSVITAGFSPPEQFGTGQTDQRSDIYALGKTLWSLLTGLDPANEPGGMFQLRSPAQLVKEVSSVMDALIMRMVEMDPAQRPTCVAELRQVLQPMQHHQLLLSRRNLLIGAGALLGVGIIGTGIFTWSRSALSKGVTRHVKNSSVPTKPAVIYNQNGVVYLDLEEEYSSTEYISHTYALSMHTGKELWAQQREEPQGNFNIVRYQQALLPVNQTVYLAFDNGIAALHTNDGSSIYQLSNSERMQYLSPFVVGNNLLFFFGKGSSGNTVIQAVHAGDGLFVWQYQISAFSSLFDAQIILSDGVLYFGASAMLYALRASDGSQVWQYQVNTNSSVQPNMAFHIQAVENGIAYAVGMPLYADRGPDSLYIYALSMADGTFLWKYHMDAYGLVTVNNNVVYINSTSSSFIALRGSDGTQLWQQSTGQTSGVGNNTPVIIGGVMYAMISNVFYALRATDGTSLWHYDIATTSSSSSVSIAVIDGTVFIGSEVVIALRGSDGHQLWQMNTPCDELQVVGNVVYCWMTNTQNQNSGMLYALSGQDGTLLWKYPVQMHGHIGNATMVATLSSSGNVS